MIWMLDADICSAHIKGQPSVRRHLVSAVGQLAMSTVTVGELLTWGYRKNAPQHRRLAIERLLTIVAVLPVDDSVARRFATIRATQLDTGQKSPTIDLFIAATAIEHGLTLVTHNTKHFVNIPGIALEDWLSP